MLQCFALVPVVPILLDKAPLPALQPAWKMSEPLRALGYASVAAGLAGFALSA